LKTNSTSLFNVYTRFFPYYRYSVCKDQTGGSLLQEFNTKIRRVEAEKYFQSGICMNGMEKQELSFSDMAMSLMENIPQSIRPFLEGSEIDDWRRICEKEECRLTIEKGRSAQPLPFFTLHSSFFTL